MLITSSAILTNIIILARTVTVIPRKSLRTAESLHHIYDMSDCSKYNSHTYDFSRAVSAAVFRRLDIIIRIYFLFHF